MIPAITHSVHQHNGPGLLTTNKCRNFQNHKRKIPTVLQWNANGLRPRLPDLRNYLLNNRTDVLAIQEPGIRPGDCRLSPYVIYLSVSEQVDGRSRAAVFVVRPEL